MKLKNKGIKLLKAPLNNKNNPIPIIIPCHRVIGSNGSLTGFGGGLKTKKFLLELESKNNRVVKIGE